jgi:mRNA interferase MazF
LKPGELVVAMLPGAVETKVRPAVIVASETYLSERSDVIVGILTTKIPSPLASTDYLLRDWQVAGLRAQSCFRAYILTLHRSNVTVVGNLSKDDWTQVKHRVLRAFAP